jgi:hypothetical protein
VFELDPGPVTDVMLDPVEKTMVEKVVEDLEKRDFDSAINDIIGLLDSHMDSNDLSGLYGQALAGSAGVDAQRLAIRLGRQAVEVRDANGDTQMVTASSGTVSNLLALADIKDTDEYRVRYLQGMAALQWSTRGRDILALPVGERANIGAMAAVHATRVMAGILGSGNPVFADKAELTAVVASNLPAMRDELVSTLQLLSVTIGDMQGVYAIPELDEDPLLVNAGMNIFSNTLLGDDTLSTEEVVDLVSKVWGR